ncbi:MAG: hypothetical protein ABI233_10940 [Chthoniobacterales bacterium]
MVDICVPGGGDSKTAEVTCTGINSSGNVVGYARQVDRKQVAFFWSPTEGFTTLGTISSGSDNGNTAYAINDLNQVTGNLIVSKGPGVILYHAYLWSPGMGEPRDLGALDGPTDSSSGIAINNLTQVVGTSGSNGIGEPMKWQKRSGMKLLGMVPGALYAEAEGVNDTGQIMGLDQTGESDRGFYIAPGVGLRLLNGLGGKSAVAEAINQNGLMVGYADDANRDDHAVRWMSYTSVPEIIPGADNALGVNNLGQVVGAAYFPK